MTAWVEPEWIPDIPENDRGPFHCYILWVTDTRQYYIGHTGNLAARLRSHFSGRSYTTAGHELRRLWISDPMNRRTDARRFEAALKSFVIQGNHQEFRRCTGLFLARGATVLEGQRQGWRGRRRR